MLINYRNCVLAVILTIFLTFYIQQTSLKFIQNLQTKILITNNTNVKNDRYDYVGFGFGATKSIIAYSLKKRLILEGRMYNCTERNTNSAISDQERNINDQRTVYSDADDGVDNDDDDRAEDLLKISHTNFYIYSAYEDERLKDNLYIRIVAMTKGTTVPNLFCIFNVNGNNSHTSKLFIKSIWNDNWIDQKRETHFNPVLAYCQVPKDYHNFGISTRKCDSSQRKRILVNKKRIKNKVNFTVCVKPMSFTEDISKRLVQWIEINQIFGVNNFVFYVINLHQNVKILLNFYKKSISMVKVNSFDLSDVWQKRKFEVMYYNDCLYKSLESNFIIPLDIDEIIIPKISSDYNGLTKKYLHKNFASFSVRNAYFKRTDNLLKSVLRTKFSKPEKSGKSIVVVNRTLTVFNHYALEALRPETGKVYFIPESDAQMNHYKSNTDCEKDDLCRNAYKSGELYYDAVLNKIRNILNVNMKKMYKFL